jgi:hypothetical protein
VEMRRGAFGDVGRMLVDVVEDETSNVLAPRSRHGRFRGCNSGHGAQFVNLSVAIVNLGRLAISIRPVSGRPISPMRRRSNGYASDSIKCRANET